jgi:hypothetical protein
MQIDIFNHENSPNYNKLLVRIYMLQDCEIIHSKCDFPQMSIQNPYLGTKRTTYSNEYTVYKLTIFPSSCINDQYWEIPDLGSRQLSKNTPL